MSSAQFHLRPEVDAHHSGESFDHDETSEAPFVLRQQAAARIAEHRARRKGSSARPAPTPIATPANNRAARIAATVAERYSHSQSYRAFLAAEAEKAIHEAEAAAEVAARTARAVTEAQLDLLDELDQWSLTPPPIAAESHHHADPSSVAEIIPPTVTASPAQHSTAGLTVRLYNDVAPTLPKSIAETGLKSACEATHTNALHDLVDDVIDEEERLALDEEIEFRQSPVFEEPAGPPIDIPANLIEFPRQLVATRRARPRIAEGPLRDEADHAPEAAQLRIFEVEPAQISTAPAIETTAPVWSSIVLDARPAIHADELASHHAAGRATLDQYLAPSVATQPYASEVVLLKDAASIELRVMAGLVDGCLVLAGFMTFVTAFALATGPLSLHNITLQNAALGSVVAIAGIALLYQVLFFSFSNATPGMKYARIALCTFSDDNPTRSALRRRTLTLALTACPLGIGLLWAWLDNDRLSWHDRLSRMYQRTY